MKALALLTLLALLPTIAGCSGEPGMPDLENDLLWPMTVGNRWVGEREYFDKDGNSLGTEPFEWNVNETIDILDEQWFVFDNDQLLTNRTDGVWARPFGSQPDDYEYMLAKYPTSLADTFATERISYIDAGGNPATATAWYEVSATDTMLDLPYGRVSAYAFTGVSKFEHADEIVYQQETWYFTPGLGPVMQKDATGGTPDFPDAERFVWRLKDATLK